MYLLIVEFPGELHTHYFTVQSKNPYESSFSEICASEIDAANEVGSIAALTLAVFCHGDDVSKTKTVESGGIVPLINMITPRDVKAPGTELKVKGLFKF